MPFQKFTKGRNETCSSIFARKMTRDELSSLVKNASKFELFDEKVVLEHKKYLVIGVAIYSRDDLELLDRIIQCGCDIGYPIFIYDVLNASDMEDINKVFHGIGKVYQTPMMMLYQEHAEQSLWGFEARKRIEEIFEQCGSS
ncbi:hypothetical protein [Pleionea sp. CnH1-48]|uniref:hypothetical protein n=1 Tax=Pleionea sp. CnH1-48 TaxID=2954494 RepID=UPI0020969E88|nr:hypothetical protein [Pleionea sp. CnH1-48]MCO7222969.1 hypothetical protein [Pleionea sp. CnH1-48]